MGEVYAARHPLIGKRAAIKVVRKELCSDESSVGRFVDEARVVNQIGHPNIVDVFSFGTTRDGRSYLVMEWLQGETLRTRLERGRLGLEDVCELMLPLIRALQAAHDSGVVHRDLKPDNLFLTHRDDGSPCIKLLDFGIARLAESDAPSAPSPMQTKAGYVLGTATFMAPEQMLGQVELIGPKTDVWSLGLLAFNLLVGREFWDWKTPAQLHAMVLSEPIAAPSARGSSLGPAFDAWFARCVIRWNCDKPLIHSGEPSLEPS